VLRQVVIGRVIQNRSSAQREADFTARSFPGILSGYYETGGEEEILESFKLFSSPFHGADIKPRPNDRNIAGRNMLRAFGYPVAKCHDKFCLAGTSLKRVKFEPATPDMS